MPGGAWWWRVTFEILNLNSEILKISLKPVFGPLFGFDGVFAVIIITPVNLTMLEVDIGAVQIKAFGRFESNVPCAQIANPGTF